MKKKIALVVIIVVCALCSMSLSYAGNGVIEFVGVGSWDNETYKFIGNVDAYIDDDGQLNISITDAYPQYEAYVNFTIKHIGYPQDPGIYITDVWIINGNKTALSVDVINNITKLPIPKNYLVDPGETLEGLVIITVLNEIDQSSSYNFGVKFNVSELPV